MTIQDILLLLILAGVIMLIIEVYSIQKNMIILAHEMDGFEERLNQIVRAK